jgi:diguanylate cyclase (GGDEF)-like protein/PAS domain S-box-containing protein
MLPALHDYILMGGCALFSVATIALAHRVVKQRGAVDAARHAETQFRALAEAIPQIVWTAIPGSGINYCNQRWYDLTGLTMQETLGSGWQKAIHRDDLPQALKNWQRSRETGSALDMEYRIQSREGSYRWHLVRATPLRDSNGGIIKWFGACADIDDQMQVQELLQQQIKEHTTALFEANERLQHESIHDPLTGLYNRRYLEDILERETRRAVRAEHGLSVILLDLDHFKRFNDTYGHDAGDTVLRETAALFLKSVRAEDIVCRYGGEEFVIILPMADFKVACARAERIREKVRELHLLYRGQPLGSITVSAGVAGLPEHGIVPKELLAAADAALYRAKAEGRDRVIGAEGETIKAEKIKA